VLITTPSSHYCNDTPPSKGGENIIYYFNFLLLLEEEYPDLSVRGRWWDNKRVTEKSK